MIQRPKRFVQRAIVTALEEACFQVDKIWNWPRPFHIIPAMFGCPRGFALWSSQLNDRWDAGCWLPPDKEIKEEG